MICSEGWIPRPKCPICGLQGKVRHRGITDKIWQVPGEWNWRKCHSCDVGWLDPQPLDFKTLYPASYITHAEPDDPLAPRRGWIANLRLGVKIEILRRAYGYDIRSANPLARLLGGMAIAFPGIRRWAGYTVRFLQAHSGRLLDVGCGNGSFLVLMARLGQEVRGIEPDPIAASYGQAKGLTIEVLPLESTVLEPESIDAITLNHVLEHLADPVGALEKLVGALKPGGLLVSISPNPDRMLAHMFGPSWRGLEPPRHLVLLGPRAVADLACKLGLRPTVWTTARNADWVARESISIRRSGNAFIYRGRWLPRLLAIVCHLLTAIDGVSGEEVVLVAQKGSPS